MWPSTVGAGTACCAPTGANLMKPFAVVYPRHTIRILLVAIALLVFSPCLRAQEKTAPGEKPKVRAITAFINLERAQYQEQVADTVKMLKYARTVFESRGDEVQTIRIATQPFPQYTKGLTTEQAVAFFKEYDALAAKEKFSASIGPAVLDTGDSQAQAGLLSEILRNTKSLNARLVVAGEDSVPWKTAGAAAPAQKNTPK